MSTKCVHTVRVHRHRSAQKQNTFKFVSWRLCPQMVSTRVVPTDTEVQRHRIHEHLCHGACVPKVCPHGSCPQLVSTIRVHSLCPQSVSTKCVHTVRVHRHRSATTQETLKSVSWRLCPQSVSTRFASKDTGAQRHRIR